MSGITELINLVELFGASEEPSVQLLALYIPDKDGSGDPIDNHKGWLERAQKVTAKEHR